MPWFKVDDNLHSHNKARNAGLSALGLWVVAGSYCGQYTTGGRVPAWFVASWPSGVKLAAQLVKAGLWYEVEGEWQFHQWDERQPSKAQVEAERARTRERQQKWRDSHRDGAVTDAVTSTVTDGVSNGVTNGVINSAPTRPDPTRPVVTPSVAQTRGSRLPDEFPLTDSMRFWARGNAGNANVDREHEKFCDYWHSRAGAGARKTDWPKTWQNWLRKASDDLQRVHAGAQRNPNIPEGWGT